MQGPFRYTLPLVAAGLLAGCGMSAEEHLQRAEQSYSAHRYEAARTDLYEVLDDDPANTAAMVMLVRTYLALEDAVAARGMLSRLETSGGLPDDAPLLYAQAALLSGNSEAAMGRVEGLRSAEAYRIRALAHLQKDQSAAAEEAFVIGQQGEGPKSRLLADYAQFLIDHGRINDARGQAERAVREQPVSHNALVVHGKVALAQGNSKAALVRFEKALKSYPDSRAALVGRIRALARLEQVDPATNLVKAGLEKHRADPELLYLGSMLAAQRNDWNKARDMLRPMERKLEEHSEANALYARIMLELGQTEQARVRLASHLLREPGNRQVRYLLGRAKLAVGDAKGAVRTLEPLLAGHRTTREERDLLARAREAAGYVLVPEEAPVEQS